VDYGKFIIVNVQVFNNKVCLYVKRGFMLQHSQKPIVIQWNLWIATPRNEDILWNKDTSSGPKLLFSVQNALWNEDTSEFKG
jgi:hypothetical protein